jgi:hypothetical protein
MDICEGAYNLYWRAWAKIHNDILTITPMKSDREERRRRRIAAQNCKVEAQLQRRWE